MIAINKKYQSVIKRFLAWDKKYNDLIDAADGDECRKAENAYNKAAELWAELPKREQSNIGKNHDVFGY
jgi:hypothetical protein